MHVCLYFEVSVSAGVVRLRDLELLKVEDDALQVLLVLHPVDEIPKSQENSVKSG